MKNFLQLLSETTKAIKDWVQMGFDELAKDMRNRSEILEQSFENSLTEFEKKIPTSVDESAIIQRIQQSITVKNQCDSALVAEYLRSDDGADLVREAVSLSMESLAVPKDGKNGCDGKDGEPGKDGRDGKDGEPGKDGKSVDPEQLQKMVDSAVKTAFSAFPKPENGKDGESVDPEELKTMVNQAVKTAIDAIPKPQDGKDGRDGKDGQDGKSVTVEEFLPAIKNEVIKVFDHIQLPKDGKDGQPGKDALQIDILPAIDPEKSYPRGIFAAHLGGIWRSFRTTDGMDGWECVVRGESVFEVRQVDERNFELITTNSAGEEKSRSVSLPVMIYRGIWQDRQYRKGDTVTWAGSLWHCNEATAEKPGTGKAWTLCAKKGRDGNRGD